MDNKYLIAILATVLVTTLLFFCDKKENTEYRKKRDSELLFEKGDKKKNFAENASEDLQNPAAAGAAPAVIATVTGGVPQIDEQVQRQFAAHLKAMQKCFAGLSPQSEASSISEKVDPTFENLLANLTMSLGEAAIQMDDWSQSEFIDRDATKKRVRVDYDYPDGVTQNRRLSMYQINSYGMPEIINLTADETNNPNESYVASLTEGREIVVTEKSARAYFSEGEELIYSTHNGLLQSFSINKQDRSFNCFNLDEKNSNCNCP